MYEQIAHFLNRGSTRPTLVGFIFAWITTKSVYCGHICDGPAQSSISRFHSLQNRLPVLVAEAYCYSVSLAIANFPFFSFSSSEIEYTFENRNFDWTFFYKTNTLRFYNKSYKRLPSLNIDIQRTCFRQIFCPLVLQYKIDKYL